MKTSFKGLLILAGVLLPVWLMWAAEAPEPLMLTAKDNGRTVSVAVGQSFTVALQLTGGQQVLTPEYDPQILALQGQSLQTAIGPEGTVSQVAYQFVVLKVGTTDLVIGRKTGRSAEPGKPYLKVRIVAGTGEII